MPPPTPYHHYQAMAAQAAQRAFPGPAGTAPAKKLTDHQVYENYAERVTMRMFAPQCWDWIYKMVEPLHRHSRMYTIHHLDTQGDQHDVRITSEETGAELRVFKDAGNMVIKTTARDGSTAESFFGLSSPTIDAGMSAEMKAWVHRNRPPGKPREYTAKVDAADQYVVSQAAYRARHSAAAQGASP